MQTSNIFIPNRRRISFFGQVLDYIKRYSKYPLIKTNYSLCCSDCQRTIKKTLNTSYYYCRNGHKICNTCMLIAGNQIRCTKCNSSMRLLSFRKILQLIRRNNRNPNDESLLNYLISTLIILSIEELQFLFSYNAQYFKSSYFTFQIINRLRFETNEFKAFLIQICSFNKQAFDVPGKIDFNINFVSEYKIVLKTYIEENFLDEHFINLLVRDPMSKTDMITFFQDCIPILIIDNKASFEIFSLDFMKYQYEIFTETYLSKKEDHSFNIEKQASSTFFKSIIYSLITLLSYYRYEKALNKQEETELQKIKEYFIGQENFTEERVVEELNNILNIIGSPYIIN